jgi:hypothetical protein
MQQIAQLPCQILHFQHTSQTVENISKIRTELEKGVEIFSNLAKYGNDLSKSWENKTESWGWMEEVRAPRLGCPFAALRRKVPGIERRVAETGMDYFTINIFFVALKSPVSIRYR